MAGRGFRASTGGSGRAQGAEISQLKTQIQEDQTVSDITKNELLAKLNASSFSSIQKEFKKAQIGRDAKFKSRQFTQAQRKILTDRPGQLQTLLTSPEPVAAGQVSAAQALITGR